MTDIEQKALKLLNEVSLYKCENVDTAPHKDLCVAFRRAIEQHEAFRQEVSDAVMSYFQPYDSPVGFQRFIIPKPKPDPLVEALVATDGLEYEPQAEAIRAALKACGFEIKEK